jgi:hypothetical protein
MRVYAADLKGIAELSLNVCFSRRSGISKTDSRDIFGS